MSDISDKSDHTRTSNDSFSRIEDDSPTALPSPQNEVEIKTDAPSMAKIEAAEPLELIPGPPPNGGLQAWLQVLGAFFLAMNSWFVHNTLIGKKSH